MLLTDFLPVKPGITAIIGSGGKTSLAERLCKELSERGTVIFTTTTHIFPPDMPLADPTRGELSALLQKGHLVCAAKPAGEKLTAPTLSAMELSEAADFVIVEADGAKRLPAKAHDRSFEPVIPTGTAQIITVLGTSCFGKPIAEVCHRPEIFCRLTGAKPDDLLSPALAARALKEEGLSETVFLNQVDSPDEIPLAEAFCRAWGKEIIAGSLRKEWYLCLS